MMYTETKRRPTLAAGAGQMRNLASNLASDSRGRSSFLSDPAGYLRSHSIGVGKCSLAAAKFACTSEVITTPTYVMQTIEQLVFPYQYIAQLVVGPTPNMYIEVLIY